MEFKAFIYKFENKINGKCYIGQTKRPKIRYKEHIKFKDKSSLLDRAINKYGIDNFVYEIISEQIADTEEKIKAIIDELEIKYIQEFNSLYPNGYNLVLGPPKEGIYKISPEQRGEATNRHKGGYGVSKGTNIGITRNESEKSNISQKLKGKIVSEETKQKIKAKSKSINHKRYKVAKVDIQTGEILEIFTSVKLASESVNCSQTNIRNVVNGKQISASGFKWIKIKED